MEKCFQVRKTIPKSLSNVSRSLHQHVHNYKLNKNRTLCSVSRFSILAFCSLLDLNDATAESWGCHVYVTDLSSPWFSFKVFASEILVTLLEWNHVGDMLLIGTRDGLVQVLRCTDYILNDWKCIKKLHLNGEEVFSGSFLHPGENYELSFGLTVDSSYLEKFRRQTQTQCTLTRFGNQSVDGCLVLTRTGILSLCIISASYSKGSKSNNQMIRASRAQLVAAAFSYTRAGNFLLALNTEENKSLIEIYKVSVENEDNLENVNDSFRMKSERIGSFETLDKQSPIIDLHWLSKEDPNELLVTQKCKVAIWELRKESFGVSKLFGSGEPVTIEKWAQKEQKTIITTADRNPVFLISKYWIFLETFENQIECVAKENLQTIGSFSFRAVNFCFSNATISMFGCLLIAIDDFGQIFVLKLQMPPNIEILTNVNNVVTILEFCLFSGSDWFELVPYFGSSGAGGNGGVFNDQMVDKFIDNFTRQSSAIQQYFFLSYLSMLSVLYRCCSQALKANDLNCLNMLHSVSTAFKVLLRPSELSSNEQSPSDSLANEMKNELHCDVDKVLCNLEAKEFTVEPSTLQSIQHLIQWVADVALNLLAKLPDHKSHASSYLIRESLPILRELLVIIRIWGLLRQSCLPIFIKSAENLDVLSILFRLLGKLAQNPDNIDDNLLDECAMLQSPVFIPNLNQVFSESLFCSAQLNYPLVFDYNVEPEFIWKSVSHHRNRYSDSIRHISIGMMPVSVKSCLRCGFITGTYINAKTATTKAWDLRWQKSCICKGFWRVRIFQ